LLKSQYDGLQPKEAEAVFKALYRERAGVSQPPFTLPDGRAIGMNKIIYVFGTSWCGSSLLNALLDSEPGVRGLGEVWKVWKMHRPELCWKCGSGECVFFARWPKGRNFFEWAFEKYACHTIIDTSKHWAKAPLHGNYRVMNMILSKSPHEHAASYVRRFGRFGARGKWSFVDWIDWYGDSLKAAGPDPLTLTYRMLATSPTSSVKKVMAWAGNQPTGKRAMRKLDTGTHIYGGSPAMQQQYERGDIRKTAYDDAWKADKPFRKACHQAYAVHRKSLDPILARVGQPNVDALQAELTDA